MSSHHIVKEDQEPALILADITKVSQGVIQELLEWSPTVVVLEKSLDEVLLWGIKIDVVISPEDHVQRFIELLADQTPIKILTHKTTESPLDTAMHFLSAAKYPAVSVAGADLAELKSFTDRFDLVVFSSGKRWSFARYGKFEKWLTKGSVISLVKEAENKNISTHGLDKNRVVECDGIITLKSDSPFWVGELY